MTTKLVFDQSESSASDFSNDVEILLDLANRIEPDIRREWTTTTTNEREQNLQYSIAKRQEEVDTVQGTFYFNGVDKSQGTIQTAVNTGDLTFTVLNDDGRIELNNIVDVDTTNDTFTVNGDKRRRVDLNSTLVVFTSTGNDGTYNPTSVSYDSGNDETTITVTEDVTDSTSDGTISTGIYTVQEQQAWLEDYVAQNIGAPQHVLKADRFDEGSEDGKKVVIENILTPKIAGRATGQYTITLRAGRPV